MKFLSKAACSLLLLSFVAALAQDPNPDPNRIFVTPLKWERIAGAPRSVKERVAYGTLAILHLEGTYAEISASFIRMDSKHKIGLNLHEGFIVRLGTWSRTDDDQLIRLESREVLRDKQVRMMQCSTNSGKQTCTPEPERPLPGPAITRTCRLEAVSTTHIADAFICSDRTEMMHLREQVNLDNFPQIVRQLAVQQKPAH
jgi:hypothetical protein